MRHTTEGFSLVIVLVLGIAMAAGILALSRINIAAGVQRDLQGQGQLSELYAQHQGRSAAALLPTVLAEAQAVPNIQPASAQAILQTRSLCFRQERETAQAGTRVLSASETNYRFLFAASGCGHNLGSEHAGHLNSGTHQSWGGGFEESRVPFVYSARLTLSESLNTEHREEGTLTLRRGSAPISAYAVAADALTGDLSGIVDGPVYVRDAPRAAVGTRFLDTVATAAGGFLVGGVNQGSTMHLGLPCRGAGCPQFSSNPIRGQSLSPGSFDSSAQGVSFGAPSNDAHMVLSSDGVSTYLHSCTTECLLLRVTGNELSLHNGFHPIPPREGAPAIPEGGWQEQTRNFGGTFLGRNVTLRSVGPYQGQIAIVANRIDVTGDLTANVPPCTTAATERNAANCNLGSTDLLTLVANNITLGPGALVHAVLYAPGGNVSASGPMTLVGSVIAGQYNPTGIALTFDPRAKAGLAAAGLPRVSDWPVAVGFGL